MKQGLFGPLAVAPPIAVGEFIGRDFGVFPLGMRHAEGFENIFVDELLIGFARYFLNNISQKRDSKIAVLVSDSWRIGKGNFALKEFN